MIGCSTLHKTLLLFESIACTRWVAVTEYTRSNRFFPAPTGSATEHEGILFMKLTMNATSVEGVIEKKVRLLFILVYGN